MSSPRTEVVSRPAIFPFAPLFRGARPFLLRPNESTALSALPVRRVTVIPSLQGEMPPRQILLDGAMGQEQPGGAGQRAALPVTAPRRPFIYASDQPDYTGFR